SLYMARTHATTTHTLPLHDALPIYPDPHGRDDFVEVNGVNIPRPGATSAEPSVPAPDGMAPPQAAPDPGPSRASMLSGATVRPPDSGPSRAAMLGVQADPPASRVGRQAQQASPKNPGSLTVFPGTGAPRHYGPSGAQAEPEGAGSYQDRLLAALDEMDSIASRGYGLIPSAYGYHTFGSPQDDPRYIAAQQQ